MRGLINWSFDHARTILIALVMILTAGVLSWGAIPKESMPEVQIPVVYVSVSYEGISPDDGERLLLRPLETQLQSVEGLREMTSTAADGYVNIILEFEAGGDASQALDDVKDAVDIAQNDLPSGANEPVVREMNTALFPVLTVMVSGPVPERALIAMADEMKTRIESLPGVLEVDLGGKRDEMVEVLIDPVALDSYNLSFEELLNQIQRNNRLVAAGAIDTGAGRLTITVPGVIETLQDVHDIPVMVQDGAVVTLGDIAIVRSTFEDPEGFARINGEPAIAMEVTKRVGANIIDTVASVRAAMAQAQTQWPETVEVTFLQDESEQIETLLSDLENNVVSAILFVMVVVIAALGVRSGILVGLAIPGSFLAGIAILYVMGYTMNMIVLFSLILVVGMLVDGAIVTIELADRRLSEGASPREAYSEAARRMAWPIIASTATTLAVFFPLLFWTGIVGEFMKFLPITVIITLSASLAMALIFVPVLGGVIGRRKANAGANLAAERAAEEGDLADLQGASARYVRILSRLLRHPGKVLLTAVVLLIATYTAYGLTGHGTTFFPSQEPEMAQVQITSRDNLSIWEKDALVRRVEERVTGVEGIEYIYARTIAQGGGTNQSQDTIGVLQLDFLPWDERRTAAAIMEEVRQRTADIAGIEIQIQEQDSGPAQGRPVQLRLTGPTEQVLATAQGIRQAMDQIGGFTDVDDNLPRPGVEWRLAVNRTEAARYGADTTTLGQAVQMLTTGLQLAEYRPGEATDEVDIRVRFPSDQRNLERLEYLRLNTQVGLVPIRNFVTLEPAPRTGIITRIDGQRAVTIDAGVEEGLLVADQMAQLQAAIRDNPPPEGVMISFGGEAEDQAEAAAFLGIAFLSAIFLMLMALVTQFNSIYQAVLVMSAIVFSTAGVFLGLMITGQPFGVVMGGIGVIALAGIVVNNNIVLIDTYNEMRGRGHDAVEAALRTGALRLRPVFLTSVTTVLGLLPMVLGMNIDFFSRNITFGAPSGQMWTELSTAIAGGLTVATVLTLVLTPCLLVLGDRVGARIRRLFRRAPASPDGATATA
ncbi:efflux RND transporter permease subunit [Halodurantibacterium flavum]|uniref:Efflux RND transporter permease subunit n=1 Tax=Halodurantibacterium flavum TaxID=1382802 RepID=A0ABW4S466_9RHOB